MRSMIEFMHRQALEVFTRYIQMKKDRNEPLCELENANFDKGIPDYENPVHASLYLMRYAAAYLSEYYLVFKTLAEKNFLTSPLLSILSIGAGSNLDGVAAHLVNRESANPKYFIYQGIDKAIWPFSFRPDNNFFNIYKDISLFTKENMGMGSGINVISLPKILSEVETETLTNFIALLPEYLDKKICVVYSNRNANKKMRSRKRKLPGEMPLLTHL